MKKGRRTGEINVSRSQKGMGDYYGTGIRNPMGKIRDVTGISNLKPAKLKKPPKSIA